MIGGKLVVGVLRRFLAVAVSSACVGALIAVVVPSAIASPIPGTQSMKISHNFTSSPVFDGLDAFWIHQRQVNVPPGVRMDSTLRKQSFSGGPQIDLVKTFGRDEEEIVDLRVGGGVVAFVVTRGEFSHEVGATSKIVRMAADGSGQSVIATGEMKIPGHDLSEPRTPVGLYDCGTEVSLSDVTPTGEVIYASVVRNRTGRGCGGSENSNEWTFTGVRPDGTTRLITTSKATVKLRIKRRRGRIVGTSCRCDRGWRFIQVRGDWAMIDPGPAFLGNSKPRLLDLNTGATSGPYSVGNLGPNGYSMTSFDQHGRVAVFGVKPVFRRSKKGKRLVVAVKFRMRSYAVPGSTAAPVQVIGTPYAFYCGDRLFSTEQPGHALELVEYDPVTGLRIGVLGEMSGRYQWGVAGCTSSHMYIERTSSSTESTQAFVVPLT